MCFLSRQFSMFRSAQKIPVFRKEGCRQAKLGGEGRFEVGSTPPQVDQNLYESQSGVFVVLKKRPTFEGYPDS